MGGTFTDVYAFDAEGGAHTAKAPTTADGIGGVLAALREVGELAEIEALAFGSTIATNALTERRLARTGLLATAGFRDVLDVRRLWRRDLFGHAWERPPAIVPRHLRLEVRERLDWLGQEVVPLAEEDVEAAAVAFAAEGVEAVAVSFLFSYLDPAHELRAAAILEARLPGVPVLVSSAVNPERKEYERTSTTVIAAALSPIVDRALGTVEGELRRAGLRRPMRVMKSNGGVMSTAAARARPVEIVKSGPAGGASAGAFLAAALDEPNLILLDIGGTTADASLIVEGRPARAGQDTIEWDIPIRVPVVDIRSIGAGGGSIARLDAAGGLRVGPTSAGADPGPAAYGRGGTQATVTDAALAVGLLDPERFLGGRMALDRAAARAALAPLAAGLGLSPEAAGAAVLHLAATEMAALVREITVDRGLDPRDFALVAFGGAGPLFVGALVEELGLRRAIVPPGAGTLSAMGGAFADITFDFVRSESAAVGDVDPAAVAAAFAELVARARDALALEGVADGEIARSADLRYAGQWHAIEVPLGADDPLEARRAPLRGRARAPLGAPPARAGRRARRAARACARADAEADAGRVARAPGAAGAATADRGLSGRARGGPRRGARRARRRRRRRGAGDRRGGADDDRRPPGTAAVGRPPRLPRGGAVMSGLDPILARVLARAFGSICTEMGSAMIRTAVSAVFVEGRDFSCALLDDRAELVAAANYDPSHLSAMALTAEYALMELGWETLAEGDVIVVNDPYRGGGHLTDIAVIRPIVVDGEVLALAMNRGHHIDVGGMAVAGFPGTARSIFQEGLRIPPVKWFEAGVERRQVMDLILLNVRFPSDQLGDFQAQVASCVSAERRLLALVERYGVARVRAAMQETKDHSERLLRAAIAAVPDGAYRFEGEVDDDGVGNGPYRVVATVEIRGDEAVVDFDGTSGQAEGPVNSSYGNTVGSCFNAFLHTFGAEIDFNGGCFRPVGFRVPRGSLLNPIPPAPVFGGVTEVSIRIIDTVCGALAQAVPDAVAAGSYATCLNVAGGGWDEARGGAYGFYLFQEGGWGGTAERDGWSSVPNPTSNFNDYPIEVLESDLPLRCHEVALHEGSGGPGRHRGGLGTRRVFELLADGCEVNALGEGFVARPHGLVGGDPGAPNAVLVQRAGAGPWLRLDELSGGSSPSKAASLPLARGDRFAMVTGGGGGHGDPYERDPAAVRDDVREGLVGGVEARERYGVALVGTGSALAVDAAETARLRALPRTAAPAGAARAPVPARALDGRAAGDVAAVEVLRHRIGASISDATCRSGCVKRGDPIRCPFHHPFALAFWDADGLARWTARNCPIARREHGGA